MNTRKNKSILQKDINHCYLCGDEEWEHYQRLEEHHIFYGRGKRSLSDKYGLVVYICSEKCHREGPEAVHRKPNGKNDKKLKRDGQKAFEYKWVIDHGGTFEQARGEFMKLFGKNYL